MGRLLAIVALFVAAAGLALAQPSDAPQPGGAAAQGKADTQAPVKVDIGYLTPYLDRMGLKYETDRGKGYAKLTMVGDHGRYDTYVVADPESALAFIIIANYLVVPPTHRNCDKVMRRLMELNWKLNVGKFEWDPTDGEVRLTFAFSTENGVGYEAFRAIFDTITGTADQYKEELDKLLASD